MPRILGLSALIPSTIRLKRRWNIGTLVSVVSHLLVKRTRILVSAHNLLEFLDHLQTRRLRMTHGFRPMSGQHQCGPARVAQRGLHDKIEVRFRSTAVKFVEGRYIREGAKSSAGMYAP